VISKPQKSSHWGLSRQERKKNRVK